MLYIAGVLSLVLGFQAGVAHATAPFSLAAADLRMGGELDPGLIGQKVAPVGDFNGDGRTDLITYGGRYQEGGANTAYIAFGPLSGGVDLDQLGNSGQPGGVRFVGTESQLPEVTILGVTGVGDVNGDGRADAAVATELYWGAGSSKAVTYVIFGGPGSRVLSAADFNQGRADGFEIDGAMYGLSSAGDVNGDGLADLTVADMGGNTTVYVVFGRTSSTPVDLSQFASPDNGLGYEIVGAGYDDQAGMSVANAGDVNGDKRPDLLIGAPNATGLYPTGRAYVVYGQASTAPVHLADFGEATNTRGLRFDGAGQYDQAGTAVAAPGDVNGDGVPDLIIGATGDPSDGRGRTGGAYVVFTDPRRQVTNLADVGSDPRLGMHIEGASENDGAGVSVSGAGDANGDGHPDVLVGASNVYHGGKGAGSAYLVYATPRGGIVDLAAIGSPTDTQGVRYDGQPVVGGLGGGEFAGGSVWGGGDINGDGVSDLLVGAINGVSSVGAPSGVVYAIYGRRTGSPPGTVIPIALPTHRARVRLSAQRVRIASSHGTGSLRTKCLNVAGDECEVSMVIRASVHSRRGSAARKHLVTVGRLHGTIKGEATGTLRVRLLPRGLAMLRRARAHTLRATASGTSRNRAGASTRISDRVVLAYRPSRARH